ncbi:MAG: TetR/AcrR family transcriptional regulator [Clostridiales bacterium]|nr:TetR/AcrR family transcriptional regulator [Clostridiales bacterium]
MNTKERILNCSLDLFSKKGYSNISVRDIAREVGVRESALYKHYKNKQDILDHIMLLMNETITGTYVKNQVPKALEEDLSKAYGQLSVERLCEMSWNLFLLYTKDPIVSNYRRLLIKEQYHNEQAASQYDGIYVSGVIKQYAKIFEKLVEGNVFIKENAETIALQFYGPIFLLFQQYDYDNTKEDEIQKSLYGHIKAFSRNYRK